MKEVDLSPSLLEFVPYYLTFVVLIFAMYFDLKYANPFMLVWLAYVIIPIVDYIVPLDNFNLSDEKIKVYEKDWRWLIPLYAAWFMDFGLMFYILLRVSRGEIC